jgi:protease I
MNRTAVITTALALGFSGLAHATDHALAATRAISGQTQVPTLSTLAMLSYDAPANAALRALVTDAPGNPNALKGKRIAIISTDGAEEVELTVPMQFFRARGAEVELIAPKAAELPALGLELPAQRATHILTVRYMENASWVRFDRTLDTAEVDDYDAVFIPGGAWNPDNLRMDPNVLQFLQRADAAGKLIATLCHGPQVLINAGLVKGRKVTGYWAIHTDLKNAGGLVSDVPVVVDGSLITARYPLDLAPFLDAVATGLNARAL